MPSFVFVVRASPAGKLGIGLGIDPQHGRIVITHVAGDGHVGRNVHGEEAVEEGDQLVGVGGTVFKVLREGDVVECGTGMGSGELRVALPALGRTDVLGDKSDAQLIALFGGTPVDEITVRTKLTEMELDHAFELLQASARPFKLHFHRDMKEDFALEGMWMRARIARVGARWRRVWVAVEAHRLPVLVAVFDKKQWPAPAAGDTAAIDAFRKRVRITSVQHAELGTVGAAVESGAGDGDITVLKAGAPPLLGGRGRRQRRLSLVEDTTRLLLRASGADERTRWLSEVCAAQVRNERRALAERALLSTKRADETRRRFGLRKAVVAHSLSMLVESSAGSVGRAAVAAAAAAIDAAAAAETASFIAAVLSAAHFAAEASADAAEAVEEMGNYVEDTLVRVAREDALARGGVWVQCKRTGRFAQRWCVLDAGHAPGDPPCAPALVGLYVHADIAASIRHSLVPGDMVLIHRRSPSLRPGGDAVAASYVGRYGVVVSVSSDTSSAAAGTKRLFKRRQTNAGATRDDTLAIDVDVRQDGTHDAPAGVVSLTDADVWRVLRPGDASRAFRALEGGLFDEEAAVVRRGATRAVAAHALAVGSVEAKSGTTTDVRLTVDGAAADRLAAEEADAKGARASRLRKKAAAKRPKEEVWTLRFKSSAERDTWLAGVDRALARLRRVTSAGRLLTEANRRRLELRRALTLASVVHWASRCTVAAASADATIGNAAFTAARATTDGVALSSLAMAATLAVHVALSASRVAELCSESACRAAERTPALVAASSAGSSSGTVVAGSADVMECTVATEQRLEATVLPVPSHTEHLRRSSSANRSHSDSGRPHRDTVRVSHTVTHGEFEAPSAASIANGATEAVQREQSAIGAVSKLATAAAPPVEGRTNELAVMDAAHMAAVSLAEARASANAFSAALAARRAAHFAHIDVDAAQTYMRVQLRTLAARACAIASCAAAAAAASAALAKQMGVRAAEAAQAKSRKVRAVVPSPQRTPAHHQCTWLCSCHTSLACATLDDLARAHTLLSSV